jgi:uncharacterized protein (DUF1778 family)
MRNKTIAFRTSPEEYDFITRLANLSGLTKQDYLIKRSLKQDIEVRSSPRTYKALYIQLSYVLEELSRLNEINPQNDELLLLIGQINDTLRGFTA